MIDDVTRSLLDSLPRGGRYDLSVAHDPASDLHALTIVIDGETFQPGIGYESSDDFEFDRDQIAAYLVTRKQKCGGCGSCSCG
ncbi:hypothetical protein [Azoarcus sp. DN11]|uniref:hypothetical protein n=1 Tax=Azoarcus sp. DN11 TaxID=356837 RepID=UPI000EB2AF1A|nr:hypothetical protein [Azoarcus sp. DN11]AYH42776.1 hypothetical protein CDA09_05150 [Azoarcus sp. DN11]